MPLGRLVLLLVLACCLAFGQAIEEIQRLAERGDADAQRNLGLAYYNGDGVPQNYAEAHKWINLAASQESKNADARDAVAARMTPTQIAEAQRLAREWKPKTWDELKSQIGK